MKNMNVRSNFIVNSYLDTDSFGKKENDIKLITPDTLELSVKLDTLKDLGVKYLLVRGELPEKAGLSELFEYSNMRIYSFKEEYMLCINTGTYLYSRL